MYVHINKNMTTFLYILMVLLGINALLLIFSVNGALDMFKRPLRRISETPILRLFDQKYAPTEYKKAI